jgi:hypothetical protein
MRIILLFTCLIFSLNGISQVPDTCFTEQEIHQISQTLDSLYFIDSINAEIISNQAKLITQLEQVVAISELQLQYKTTQIDLLQNNIKLYIEREKLTKPKWYSHPAIWFTGGVITTIGLTSVIIGIIN